MSLDLTSTTSLGEMGKHLGALRSGSSAVIILTKEDNEGMQIRRGEGRKRVRARKEGRRSVGRILGPVVEAE